MINLIIKEIALLKTKLRHVNIYNYWLRQKVQNKKISVNYRPFAQIMANGLIKALSSTKWQTFLNQIEFNDGTIHRSEGSAKDKVEELTSFLEELYP
jgi:hypothetical protein